MAIPTIIATSSLPTPIPPNMARAVQVWLTKLDPPGEGREIMACDAPSAEQRLGLERRRDRIDAWLRPAEIIRLEEWIAAVVGTMGFQGGSADEGALTLGVYVTALRSLPGFAVEAACAAFLGGRVPGQRLGQRPTPPELCVEARRQAQPLHDERRRIANVLNAKIVMTKRDPVRRARVLAEARSLARHMRFEGQKAEAERAGQIVKDPVADALTDPEKLLERLRQEASSLPAPELSPEAKRAYRVA